MTASIKNPNYFNAYTGKTRTRFVPKSHCLKISLICLAIAVAGILFIGCATTKDYVQPSCVPRSIYQSVGVSLEMKHPVRIVISHTADPLVDHAQAQAFVDGRWIWLTQQGDVVFLSDINEEGYIDPSYRPLTPYKYLTVSDIIDELKVKGRLK
uniref:Uncharacterized protein n=1 Tax=viral metagenome TaxID=1070528 RepID=A0A6M3Y0Y2_9ZZZZ